MTSGVFLTRRRWEILLRLEGAAEVGVSDARAPEEEGCYRAGLGVQPSLVSVETILDDVDCVQGSDRRTKAVAGYRDADFLLLVFFQ